MERLIDFLNHGLLPFTGRAADVERIIRFWRGTFEAQELRGALLLGEAGIGKSRLLDETLPRIAGAGGAVVHAKLVPESTTSLLPLIAQGLWYSDVARRLIKGEPEPTHAGVAGALRRISRLRPTLLVLEDIHLISGDALREFSTLLDAITDETISVLYLARPVELAARAIIERSLIEEIELAGLSGADLEELWQALFGGAAEGIILERLGEVTGGNPLALRSALRGAVRSGIIALDSGSGRWRSELAPEALTRTLRRNVDLLIEGMAAHLTGKERADAARLAALGEVFAPESAAVMIEEAEKTIESLLFKGVIAPATGPLPLVGSSPRAYTFSHTLLHQYLVESDAGPADRLLTVIAEEKPLYSTLPFSLVPRKPLPSSPDPALARRVVDRSIALSFRLDAGPDWPLAAEILRTAWHLFTALHGSIDEMEERLLEATLLSRTLSSLRRSIGGEEFERHLARLLELTSPPLADAMRMHRIRALHHLHLSNAIGDYDACADVWRQVEDLLQDAPELAGSEAYLHYLDEVARAAQRVPDPAMLRRVEERLTRLLASPDLDPRIRALAQERVAPSLLLLFDTEEELESRLALLRDRPRKIDGSNASLELNRIALLETTGRMVEALEAATSAAERFDRIGLSRNTATVELIALCARAALGEDLLGIEQKAARLGSGPGYRSTSAFRRNIGIYLTEIGMLRGDAEWTLRVDRTFGSTAKDFWPEGGMLLTRDREELLATIEELSEEEEPQRLLRALGTALIGRDEQALRHASALFARPLLRLDDILLLRATLMLITMLADGRLRDALNESVRAALTNGLAWLEERKLAACMAPLIEGYGEHLEKKEANRWRSRLRELANDRPAASPGPDAKLRISLIGAIGVAGPDGRPQPLRGARLRMMLGLLAAACMVREPLTQREFCRIAAGGEPDPDLARKTAIMAAARLRDAIGAEAVLTGEPMYLLNLDRVSVDLIEARKLIEEAGEALRRRALLRAYPPLIRALEITRGEVLFPGLYDEFFEAIRDDFDYTLRTAVIDVARALLRESDTASAETLLRLAFDCMRDDEEIAELLRSTLAAAGHRTDAERVRMRAEDALESLEEP